LYSYNGSSTSLYHASSQLLTQLDAIPLYSNANYNSSSELLALKEEGSASYEKLLARKFSASLAFTDEQYCKSNEKEIRSMSVVSGDSGCYDSNK